MTLRPIMRSRFIFGVKDASRHGVQILPENIKSFAPELTMNQIQECWEDEQVIAELEKLGLALTHSPVLSARQQAALAIYMDMTIEANHAARLRLAGVHAREWEGWMGNPHFSQALSEISEDRMADVLPRAKVQLGAAADRGERWAVEMLMEVMGRHDRRAANIDVKALLRTIFGILDEAGVDREILKLVADKIRAEMGEGQAPVMQIQSPQ